MSRTVAGTALLLAAACTPTLNWREVPVDATGLKATFPCKPDKVERRTQFAPGRDIVLHAMACEAGGASFVLLYGDAGSPAELDAALVQWKKASAATIHSTLVKEQPWQPPGALGLASSSMTTSRSPRAQGGNLEAQAAYFARGTLVYQAAVYAPRLEASLTESFFTGLRFE
jgi:hypothetical protein